MTEASTSPKDTPTTPTPTLTTKTLVSSENASSLLKEAQSASTSLLIGSTPSLTTASTSPIKSNETKKTLVYTKTDKESIPRLVNFFAGGFGGMMGALITCPLEVVKTRLQARNNKHFVTEGNFRWGLQTFGFLGNIARKEGILALWRGVDSHLAGVIPSRALWFGTYLTLKDGFDRHYKKDAWQVSAFCTVFAGFTTVSFTCPIWVVKTRMQLQTSLAKDAARINYKNSLDCAYRIFKEEGPFAFYKGLTASYVGIVESLIQLVSYERLKSMAQEYKYERMKDHQKEALKLKNPVSPHTNVRLSELEYFTLASISKIVAAALTYPHEVIRTRLREERTTVKSERKYRGILQGLSRIGREEGVRGMYGGLASHLLRVVPNAAILFVSMESFLNVYKYLTSD